MKNGTFPCAIDRAYWGFLITLGYAVLSCSASFPAEHQSAQLTNIVSITSVKNRTLSTNDVRDRMSFFIKLDKHSDPVSAYVWNHLSAQTQAGIVKTVAERANYADVLKPESRSRSVVELLIEDLNKLIESESIYDSNTFSRVLLNSDARRLLAQSPQRNLLQLNWLLLQNAFRSDIWPPPKIVVNPVSNFSLVIDYRLGTVSLYDNTESFKWEVEIGPEVSKAVPTRNAKRRPKDIQDAEFFEDYVLVTAGTQFRFKIEASSGEVTFLGSD